MPRANLERANVRVVVGSNPGDVVFMVLSELWALRPVVVLLLLLLWLEEKGFNPPLTCRHSIMRSFDPKRAINVQTSRRRGTVELLSARCWRIGEREMAGHSGTEKDAVAGDFGIESLNCATKSRAVAGRAHRQRIAFVLHARLCAGLIPWDGFVFHHLGETG